MASRYDRRTTTFSPDGRLFQVEYAMEAIRQASACIGITYDKGILLVGEKNIKSKLWIPERSEKFAIIADHIVVAIAGITADANILVDDSQLNAARYQYKYQQPMPLEMCVHDTCNYTQYFTQFGGLRPFGVSMLWAGYNKKDGFQLFHSDPSGNYAEWQATSIGNNAKSAQSILKEDFKQGLTLDVKLKYIFIFIFIFIFIYILALIIITINNNRKLSIYVSKYLLKLWILQHWMQINWNYVHYV